MNRKLPTILPSNQHNAYVKHVPLPMNIESPQIPVYHACSPLMHLYEYKLRLGLSPQDVSVRADGPINRPMHLLGRPAAHSLHSR